MKTISAYILSILTICLAGALLVSCDPWDLPTRKTKRNCVKPSGTLTTKIQQRQVDFAVEGSSGTIDKVQWDFGNNSTTVTSGLSAKYTYPTSGTYTVKVTLSNTCGDETTLSQTIVVSDAVLPAVTLQSPTDISLNSASFRLTLTSTGNATITRYGICYSSSSGIPEVDKDRTADVKGGLAINDPKSFTALSLEPNTLYYVRAFAYNEKVGPAYSTPVITFRTGSLPSVATNGISNVATTTANVNFVLNNAGSPAAVEYGICYSSSTNAPDVNNSSKVGVTSPSVGTNTLVGLTSLTPNTTYFYRAYAKLPSGEIIYSLGPAQSFTTQAETVTQDLVASISFTDRSLQDASGNGNHVKLVNNPTFTEDRKGNPNSAIYLNGQGSYFYMDDSESLNPDALSVSIWIKPIAITSAGRAQIYNKSRFSDSAHEVYSSLLKPNENGTGVTVMTNIKQGSNCQAGKGWQDIAMTSNVEFNKWHQVVLTYSGNTARMYYDGTLISVQPLPTNSIDKCRGGELKFGAQVQFDPDYFYGSMDDIRIYRRVLSDNEVKILFNQ
ncbi:PKD domain containing protein [Fibrisoma limi BUZ 3]|uniref:PKD domain containing protein n=1 Tax=Fibrisoma limi BUZ 3 TaxID=1185876 RepID=I2GJS5_9BACT|nr:LamG-like jellyroll fold domain-containing protein [Fibrisoma limi]CCH54150.1 PKD domain containing protein [Fibrisoma limi BUZ 3]